MGTYTFAKGVRPHLRLPVSPFAFAGVPICVYPCPLPSLKLKVLDTVCRHFQAASQRYLVSGE